MSFIHACLSRIPSSPLLLEPLLCLSFSPLPRIKNETRLSQDPSGSAQPGIIVHMQTRAKRVS